MIDPKNVDLYPEGVSLVTQALIWVSLGCYLDPKSRQTFPKPPQKVQKAMILHTLGFQVLLIVAAVQ